MSLLLTHCILNKLSHPIYWTSPFSLFNLFHLFIYFFFFFFFFGGGGGGVGYSVSPLIYFLTTKNTVEPGQTPHGVNKKVTCIFNYSIISYLSSITV